MPVDLNVSLDPKDIARLRRLMQINRLTAAKSLTFVAEDAEDAWRGGLGVFHQRNTWLRRGLRKRAATANNLSAQVGTLDKFFGRHVVGLDEDKHGKLFIPTYDKISDVPTHRQIRAALQRARNTKTCKPFWLHGAGGRTWLARRIGKKRSPLKILGKLQQGARIPDRFDAQGIVERAVERGFSTIYERLLLRALEKGL